MSPKYTIDYCANELQRLEKDAQLVGFLFHIVFTAPVDEALVVLAQLVINVVVVFEIVWSSR